jgi:hypothetical protein
MKHGEGDLSPLGIAAGAACSLPRLRYRIHTSFDGRLAATKNVNLFKLASLPAASAVLKPGVT